MSATILPYIPVALMVLSIIVFVISINIKNDDISTLLAMGGVFTFIVCFFFIFINANRLCVAYAKGMEKGATISEFRSGYDDSPFESDIPEDLDELKGSLIVFYEYTSSDCHAVMDDIETALADYENVYYISTASRNSEIVEKYSIESVPTLVYVYKGSATEYHSSSLAVTSGSDEVVPNTEGLNEILALREVDYGPDDAHAGVGCEHCCCNTGDDIAN